MSVPKEYWSGVTERPEQALFGATGPEEAGARISQAGDSIEIRLADDGAGFVDEVAQPAGGFHENLAEYLYSNSRTDIAHDLIEYFRVDQESRADWEERVKTALHMLGLKKRPSDKLPFPDAANVVHPGIAIACVQYQARAIEEYFPAAGPVKAVVVGKASKDREEQAARVEDFMNWYYTAGDKGYFPDTDQLLMKLPMYGSVLRKSYPDPRNGLPMQRHVNGWDFIAPYNGQDLESMSRYCHRYYMGGNDVRRSIARGYFRDVDLPRGNVSVRLGMDGQTRPDDVSDDRAPVMHEDDDLYEILEYHIDYELPQGIDADIANYALPYIIHVERHTREVLRVERNWRETDPAMTKRVWFTHYRYLPGLGFYGFGLLHVIGSLGEAANGAVCALLDSATRTALSGGFKSKDLKIGGEVVLEPGKWKDVNATAEELKNGFFSPPPPQGLEPLFSTLELLTTGIDRFASTTEAMVGDAPMNGPVGTALAVIEQGSKLFSGIHKRTHAAARHEFELFGELVAEFGPYERYPYAVEGEDKVVLRADFDERVDVLPVSDPNIWSSTQRIALAQATLQIVMADQEIFGREQRVEAYRRMMVALRTPDIEKILPEEVAEPHLDPVSENMRMMTGQRVKAWPHQKHEAHVAVHENWLQLQVASQPEEVLQMMVPQAMAHIQEHRAYLYQQQVMAQLGVPLPIPDLGGEVEPMPQDLEALLSAAAAMHLLPAPNPEAEAQTQEAMSEEQIKDMAAQKEQQRKEVAAQSEQQRKDMAAQKDQQRKDAVAQKEQARLDLKSALDRRRKEMDHAVALRHTAEDAGQRLRIEALGFAQRVEEQRAMGALKVAQAAKKAKDASE